jgi:hypothetical protein
MVNSPIAKMLGSPDFPKSALEEYRMSEISLFQEIYQRSSRLKFTQASDRWPAIAALEARLLSAFKTRGGFGIFENFLGLSLLWRRANVDRLFRTSFRLHHNVPSWSCMAYTGEISYLDLSYDQVDWDTNIKLHFGAHMWDYMFGNDYPTVLIATAWKFDVEKIIPEARYDVPEDAERKDQRCVVVGVSKRTKGNEMTPQAYYLLLVAPISWDGEWERLGVALAEREDLRWSESIAVWVS